MLNNNNNYNYNNNIKIPVQHYNCKMLIIIRTCEKNRLNFSRASSNSWDNNSYKEADSLRIIITHNNNFKTSSFKIKELRMKYSVLRNWTLPLCMI